MTHDFIGTHIISQFYDIQENLSCDAVPELIAAVRESCSRNGISVMKADSCIFENGGYTVFLLLKESHLSIHTYVEYKSAFIDIFSCGNADTMNVLNDIKAFYYPKRVEIKSIRRGEGFHAQ